MFRMQLSPRPLPLVVHLAATLALIPWIAGSARAADILINNGLDCSDPGNVIDDSTHGSDHVYVRNVGCGTPDPWSPCAAPGDPTEVCVDEGAEVEDLAVLDSSTVTMSSGLLSGLSAYDFSTVTMSGGFSFGLGTHGSSTFTFRGGQLFSLIAWDSSTVTMSDGRSSDLTACDSSTITMSEGWLDFLLATGFSTVMISGGLATGLGATDSSTVTMSGGTVGLNLSATGSSTITIVGSNFAVDGSPVPFGDLAAQTGTLTGRLALRDPINNVFQQGGGDYTGTITLAPPGYLVVPALSRSGYLALVSCLLIGTAGWLIRRRPVAGA